MCWSFPSHMFYICWDYPVYTHIYTRVSSRSGHSPSALYHSISLLSYLLSVRVFLSLSTAINWTHQHHLTSKNLHRYWSLILTQPGKWFSRMTFLSVKEIRWYFLNRGQQWACKALTEHDHLSTICSYREIEGTRWKWCLYKLSVIYPLEKIRVCFLRVLMKCSFDLWPSSSQSSSSNQPWA